MEKRGLTFAEKQPGKGEAMRKKEGIVVVAALLAMALTACGEQKTETAEPEQIQQSGTETVELGKEQTEESSGNSAQGEAEAQSVIRYPMDFYGRYAINDQNIYFCYVNTLFCFIYYTNDIICDFRNW